MRLPTRCALAAVVPLVLLLPGCTQSVAPPSGHATSPTTPTTIGPPVPPRSGNGTTPATPPTTWLLRGCTQFHTTYAAQADSFASRLPPGFTPVATAGVVSLSVVATRCGAPPDTHVIVAIPVRPPAPWDNGTPSQFALEAYVGDAAFLAWLHAGGASTVAACTCSLDAGGGTATFSSTSANGTYTFAAALGPDSGVFAGGVSALYLGDATHVVRLTAAASDSQTLGTGEGVLRHDGAGGAPPAMPTELTHVVSGLDETLRVERLR